MFKTNAVICNPVWSNGDFEIEVCLNSQTPNAYFFYKSHHVMEKGNVFIIKEDISFSWYILVFKR